MNVSEISLTKFMKHASTRLQLPARGVVLVSGPNGGGKSSIVEGVSWACYGETLRGTRPTEEGAAAVITDKGKISRERRSGKVLVEWSEGSAADTATKAQEVLDAALGNFELWRRTHVFSSADAAHFTLATDKERKLFLEQMLGLARFDAALETCRLEIRAVERKLADCRSRATEVQTRLEGLEARKADAERQVGQLGNAKPPEVDRAQLAELNAAAQRAGAAVSRSRMEEHRLNAEKGAAFAEVQQVERQLARLAKPGAVCGECRRPLPVDVEARAKLEAAAAEARRKAEGTVAELAEQLAALREEVADDEATLQKIRSKAAALQHADSQASALGRAKEQALKTLDEVAARLAEERKKAEALIAELPALQRDEEVLAGAERVLGLKGARAGILARLLAGIEAAANAWLAKVAAPGLRLELKPYAEKKSGSGVSDAISLQVHGAGGGHGYKAASGGERRRIDVALLLAFAGAGTLFFDEVFDALDGDGVDAVVKVLEELAADRCVVVVTHSDELKARVQRTACRWYVSEGKVTEGA